MITKVKGIKLLKIRISFMRNDRLISNWKHIREQNEQLDLEDLFDKNQTEDIKQSMLSEELLTGELVKRGLFELAINQLFYSPEDLIQKKNYTSDFLLYYT